jgi:hypothetical protein
MTKARGDGREFGAMTGPRHLENDFRYPFHKKNNDLD